MPRPTRETIAAAALAATIGRRRRGGRRRPAMALAERSWPLPDAPRSWSPPPRRSKPSAASVPPPPRVGGRRCTGSRRPRRRGRRSERVAAGHGPPARGRCRPAIARCDRDHRTAMFVAPAGRHVTAAVARGWPGHLPTRTLPPPSLLRSPPTGGVSRTFFPRPPVRLPLLPPPHQRHPSQQKRVTKGAKGAQPVRPRPVNKFPCPCQRQDEDRSAVARARRDQRHPQRLQPAQPPALQPAARRRASRRAHPPLTFHVGFWSWA